jgi:hypothetical protein
MSELIDTVHGEETSLELHVKLCEQRYKQLINKFDVVDSRLDKIEEHIVDIKEVLTKTDSDTLKKYLSWAGVLITALLGVVVHFLIK